MTEFAYNNAKKASIGYMYYKFKYGYHSCILNKKKEILNLYFKSKTAENYLPNSEN